MAKKTITIERNQMGIDYKRCCASKNRDTQYVANTPYVVKGSWKHRTWEDQQGKLRHENVFFITDIQAL